MSPQTKSTRSTHLKPRKYTSFLAFIWIISFFFYCVELAVAVAIDCLCHRVRIFCWRHTRLFDFDRAEGGKPKCSILVRASVYRLFEKIMAPSSPRKERSSIFFSATVRSTFSLATDFAFHCRLSRNDILLSYNQGTY